MNVNSCDKAKAFIGEWSVDKEVSDSLDPLLKGLKLQWPIRKELNKLQFRQVIEVEGNQFAVTNISLNGEDKVVHMMNAGEKVIRNRRGDIILDNCTFNEEDEYPFVVYSELPNGLGFTTDRRRILGDGKSFEQQLHFRPDKVGTKDVVMKRVFRRSDYTPATDDSKQAQVTADKDKSKETPEDIPIQQQLPENNDLQSSLNAILTNTSLDVNVYSNDMVEHYIALLFILVATTVVFDYNYIAGLGCGALYLCLRYIVFDQSNVMTGDNQTQHFLLVALSLIFITFTILIAKANHYIPISACISSYILYRFKTSQNTPSGAQIHESVTWLLVILAVIGFTLSYMETVASTDDALSSYAAVSILSHSSYGGFVAMLLFYLYARSLAFVRKLSKDAKEKLLLKQLEDARQQHKDNLSISIEELRVVDDNYTQFKLCVKYGFDNEWIIWRRYSDFRRLLRQLRPLYAVDALPKCPPKRRFGNNTSATFVERRKDALNNLLIELFNGPYKTDLSKMQPVREFLKISESMESTGEPSYSPFTPQIKDALLETRKLILAACAAGETDGWALHSKQQGVNCYLKKQGEFTFTKGVGIINAPVAVVVAYMSDSERREEYDDMFKAEQVLHRYDPQEVTTALGGATVDESMLRHMMFKSPAPMIIGARDTVLASCRVREDDGGVSLFLVSIDNVHPVNAKYVRAKVFGAGIVCKPFGKDKQQTMITNVQMMDPNGSIPGWIIEKVAPQRCMMSAIVDSKLKNKAAWPEPIAPYKPKSD